jgi:RNA polymerase sigma-70 factor (ECF subfamily)
VGAEDAEDLVQDVFLIVHEGVAERGFVLTPRLLARILKLVLSAHRRAHRRRPPHDDVDELEVPASEPGAEQRLCLAEAIALIDAVLERLPVEMAEVVRLVELEENGAGEVAEMLRRPAGTVRSQHKRGLARFARELSRLQNACKPARV